MFNSVCCGELDDRQPHSNAWSEIQGSYSLYVKATCRQKAINDLQQVGALNLFNMEPKGLNKVGQKNSDPSQRRTTSNGELQAHLFL